MSAQCIPRLALTPGEPAGIGPDIVIQAAQQRMPGEVVVLGSRSLLLQRAAQLQLPLTLYPFDPHVARQYNGKGRLAILDIPLLAPCIPGQLAICNAPYVLKTLQQATQLCQAQLCDALITGPVHKAIIAESGVPFSGHTEFLAQQTNVKDVLMTFLAPNLVVSLVTTHCALTEVSTLLTPLRLKKAIEQLHHHLIHSLHIPHPKIAVCGLNPHAGENGLLGQEENTLLIPIIHEFQEKGWLLQGPLPADTVFTPPHRQAADAILAMYHDQGLAPLKALFFNEIVNVTLGLPFIRTSVDHGTALSLAGSKKAKSASLLLAIQTAARLILGLPHALCT